jgi:hypothetical protein
MISISSVQWLAGAALVLLLALSRLRNLAKQEEGKSTIDLPIPPLLRSKVPVVGHLWGVFRESHKYFIRLW